MPVWLLRALPFLLIAAVIGLYTWWIENVGYERGRAELAEYIAKQATENIAARRVVEKIVREVEVKYVDRVRVIEKQGATIINEVPTYVTKADDSACQLRTGFVRIVDAAAKGEHPGPPSDADRTSAGITLVDASGVIADNYKTCRLYKARAEAVTEAYQKAKALYDVEQRP